MIAKEVNSLINIFFIFIREFFCMRINLNTGELNSKLNNDKVSENTLSSSGVSIFSVLNKCIEKADTNADGKLSEQEISAFMQNSQSELLDEIQKKMGDEADKIDFSTLQQMFNMVKTVIGAEADISEDVSNLNGMSKDDFIKNAGDAVEDEEGSNFWKMIGSDNAENIFNAIDTDGDGKLSEEEVKAVSNFDENDKNISLSDLGNFFKTKEEVIASDTTEADKTVSEAPVSGEHPTVSQPSVSSPSGGSSYNAENVTSGNNVPQVQEKARTEETIQQEIDEQETLKNTTKETAKAEIAEQENLINQAINESDLSDEFKAEYEKENTRLSGLIDEKQTAIDEQKKLEQDYTAEANSYTTSISSIESQISTMNSEKASLDSSKDADKIADYSTKIANLEAEKTRLENAKKTAEENAEKAKNEAEKLKQEKSGLETEKENILDTLSEKYSDEKDKVEAVKEQIKQYQENIKDIQTKLETDLATIDSNIQTLKNEKAQLAQEAKTKEVLAENRVKTDTTPIDWTGETSREYWESIGYDADYGEQLLNGTIEATKQLAGSQNNCLGGVKRGFKIAFGTDSPFGAENQGITAASQCLGTMQNSENFREITGISIDQAGNLPAGTIVVWTSSTHGSSAASKYGHIAVLDGKGNEASGGRYDTIFRRVGENGVPHFFIPVR